MNISANPRPTPGTTNSYAEAMRQVPAYEPRCIMSNVPSRMQQIVTDTNFSPGADACACPGDPTFFNPGTVAQIDGGSLVGRPDTQYRLVAADGVPPILTMGKMHKFLRGLGQDDFTPQENLFLDTGIDITPTVPIDTTEAPITGQLQAPTFPTTPIDILNVSSPSPTINPTSTAITGAANIASQLVKATSSPTPGTTALTAAQLAAMQAAQNPLNKSVGVGNLTVGNLLLMAGVLVTGAVLISQLK